MQNTSTNLTQPLNSAEYGAGMPQNSNDTFTNNLNNLKILMQNGIIPFEQGQDYVMNLLKATVQMPSAPETQSPQTVSQAATAKPQSQPQTVAQPSGTVAQAAPQTQAQNQPVDARQYILDYFQNSGVNQEEINTLSGYLNNYANDAVNKYKQQLAQNETAKGRLHSNAQNTTSDTKIDRIYSADEIGKMTTDEFLENEKAIYAEMRKGRIRL